jgi:UDP-glucose 4-epimerase
MRAAVTGGAGFIGSHITDSLIAEGHSVLVIDDLSSGNTDFVNPKAEFVKKDIREDLTAELKGVESLFHFAADPDVRASATNPKKFFDINVNGTCSVLEACRKAGVKSFVLASTSTVYGETDVIPTPETHHCMPISIYGASKLACEAYLSAYSSTYGIKGTTLRYANVFGERSTHGVMFDFYNKLKKDPARLEILGDGRQTKSYLHISDCVSATLTAWKKQEKNYDVFNVGMLEQRSVTELALSESRALGLDPELSYTGSERGWAGDVKTMLLDPSKLEALGWSAKTSFDEGIKKYVGFLESGQ